MTLRQLQPARDATDLYPPTHGDAAGEATWTYMGYGPFENLQAMEDWLSDRAQSIDPMFFAVVDNASIAAIGMVSLLNVEPEHRRLEVGHIWYVPEARRTTANTEATYLLLTEAFEHYMCRRVEWKCDALNADSRMAAERLGFSFEGFFRNHMIVKGRNRDTAWYAMTDEEWPAIKATIEQWLYQLPRDEHGWPGSLEVSPPIRG